MQHTLFAHMEQTNKQCRLLGLAAVPASCSTKCPFWEYPSIIQQAKKLICGHQK